MMTSVYYCKECYINFPGVSAYLKHRKLFCHLGRVTESEDRVDGIGKLSLSDASKRVQEAIQIKIKNYDPQVYTNVEEVLRYKKERRERALKVNSNRSKVLEIISSLRAERRRLIAQSEAMRRKYESIRAYSKVSSLPVPGLEEMVSSVRDLEHAVLYLEDEIESNVNRLEQVELGHDLPSLTRPSLTSTRDSEEGGCTTPQLSVTESRSHHSPTRASSPTVYIDSTVDELDRLRRQRDILFVRKEIATMEEPLLDSCVQLLSDAALIRYSGEGFVVLLDYLTPTFVEPCVAKLRLYKTTEAISPETTYLITPSKSVVPLDLNVTYVDVQSNPDISLILVITTAAGDEIGWAVFTVFDERALNVGAWRVSLKVPPFSTGLISTKYHGVRSHNYSVRIRCAHVSLLERLQHTEKLKLPHYKLHNPCFTELLLMPIQRERNIIEKDSNKEQPVRAVSVKKVLEVYGPPDPVTIYGSSGSVAPNKHQGEHFNPAPPRTPSQRTPSVRSLRPFPKAVERVERILKIASITGYHLQHLQSTFDTPVTIHLTSWGKDLTPLENSFTSTKPTIQSSVRDLHLLSNEKIEYKSPPYISIFSITSSAKNQSDMSGFTDNDKVTDEVMGWCCLQCSDKNKKLAMFAPPVPTIEELEEELCEKEDLEYEVLEEMFLTIRYYTKRESYPSYLLPFNNMPKLGRPRIPSGAMRRSSPESQFDPPSSTGFTLVIDGARYLPTNVTVSRVCGRVFDRKFNVVGPQISTGVVLESDIYNPLYKYHVTLPGNLPSTSTVVLKIYSLHVNTGKLVTIGYSLLPLFCKRGSVTAASDGDTVALNQGLHQIPVHVEGPDASEPLVFNTFQLQQSPVVACASLLVRILPSKEVPLMPVYSEGGYTSPQTQLSLSETFVLDSHRKRPITKGSDMLEQLQCDPSNVLTKLTRFKGQTIQDMLTGDVLCYEEGAGFGVRVNKLLNFMSPDIPLLYFKLCTASSLHLFNDMLVCNTELVTRERQGVWNDLPTFFVNRIASEELLLLIQVLRFSPATKQYTSLGWTSGPIFSSTDTKPFLYNEEMTVPLIKGSPNTEELLNSGWQSEGSGASVVLEIFDTRYHSDRKKALLTSNYDKAYLLEYSKLVQEGVNHLFNTVA